MSETRKGENNPMFGKTLTSETRAKLSAALMGNTNHPSNLVTVHDIATDVATQYSSIRKAAEALHSNIRTLWG